MQEIRKRLVVAGGGPAGICAALAAARLGIDTVLVGDRPVLGGNSSSEIRVWTRGATGAGSLFAEEMGIWGGLKLKNFYRNPDGNPIFWSETLLDAVMGQKNLEFFLNTELFDLKMEGGRIVWLEGIQQGTERRLRFLADCFIDATGDGTIAARAGLPFYIGDQRVERYDDRRPDAHVQGSSILYYTRKEDHPVVFIPPDYAYSMEKIKELMGRGGRIITEQSSGSDCWWFEYGGIRDTIGDAQDIALELRRLVMGVWNYIKNSGRFDAEYYTLEWLGSLPGKRESRRMVTDYLLRGEDLQTGKTFPDGAFYGGWYMDFHPAGGMHDTGEDNCIQIPLNVYQVPLRCLYNRQIPNLILAGRDIGTEREAFVSSRVMNTCALSGQAAGTLAAKCIDSRRAPGELEAEHIESIRETLMKEDMFIPGAASADSANLAARARASASSVHTGACGEETDRRSLELGGFVTFPALEGETITLRTACREAVTLRAAAHLSRLPSRFCPGREAGTAEWTLESGEHTLEYQLPAGSSGMFCTLVFEPAAGAELLLCRSCRTGFLCGRRDSPQYDEPMAEYKAEAGKRLYGPEQAVNGYDRPWGAPNQWRAAPEDPAPWLDLVWDGPVELGEVRIYLDPELSMELPSSRARHWDESHHFTPRTSMPGQLLRDLRLAVRRPDGGWETVAAWTDNCQRLLTVRLPRDTTTSALRLWADRTWGEQSAAVFEIRAYR